MLPYTAIHGDIFDNILYWTWCGKCEFLKRIVLKILAGSDNPLVEGEYKGKQSNVILTTHGESTLKIFGE